jgi:hypothetical protein
MEYDDYVRFLRKCLISATGMTYDDYVRFLRKCLISATGTGESSSLL